MGNFWTKVLGDKQEWRVMEARADALPRDYRIVYGEIKPYLFRFTSGDGTDTMVVLQELLALFETSAAEGKTALEVTGEDVAAFCDEHLRGAPSCLRSYIESYLGKGPRFAQPRSHREARTYPRAARLIG
jgi:DNA-binding ferritin-like protein (Dps family)